ncbi:MAG: WbqC family protein, partial [Planctomycetota bacterium]
MKCVIHQPSYIPWRGYFHQIYKADIFIFYDDVQYDKYGWRNRNKIKTSQGSKWLTIPVLSKNTLSKNIILKDIRIDLRSKWNIKHLNTIKYSYARSPYFKEYVPMLEEMYAKSPELLVEFTIKWTIEIAKNIGITSTKYLRSSDLGISGQKTERLISILRKIGASHYISGPTAKDYLDENLFKSAGISLEYMTYNFSEYKQLYSPFDPHVSILDLLLMHGPNASHYIWGDEKE